MRPSILPSLLAILTLLYIQPTMSQNVQLSTIVFTSTIGSASQQSTTLITSVVTVQSPSASSLPSNSTNGTNGTNSNSGSITNSSSSTSTSTISSNLPTAPTNLPGSGFGGEAPVPGGSAAGGVLGPDDNYTAGAIMNSVAAILLCSVATVAGASLVLL